MSKGWSDWHQIWYTCRFIWERIYAKQIALRDTMVHMGGFRGSNIQVRGSCQTPGPICTNFGSRLRIHLGMGIQAKYKSPLNTPEGMSGGGVRGSHIQKYWEAVKRLDRLAPNLVHVCGFIWEWT